MRRYVWYLGKVRLDTGLRDYRGFLCLWDLLRDGEGFTADPDKVYPVGGSQLAACIRIWGTA